MPKVNPKILNSKPLSFFKAVKEECVESMKTLNKDLATAQAEIEKMESDLNRYSETLDSVNEYIDAKIEIVRKTEGLQRYSHKGEMRSVYELQQLSTNGISRTALACRLKRGWLPERAVTVPVRVKSYA